MDAPLHGGRVKRAVDSCPAPLVRGLDFGVSDGSGMRGGGGVVFLGDLRAVADLANEFLLRVEVIAQQRLLLPDLIEQQQFCFGVIAQVADQLTYCGPVLLLDVGAVVLLPERDRVNFKSLAWQ